MKFSNGNEDNPILSENQEDSMPYLNDDRRQLRAECDNCFGLCCVALYFSASEGFPSDKEAGQPCLNLQPDFRCGVYQSLRKRGMKGCVAFDCFGAGQKVSQASFDGHDWQTYPESTEKMFEVFLIMRQLHELLWYLTDALTLQPARSIHDALSSMLEKIEGLTLLSPDTLLEMDLAKHREEVNNLLLKTSKLVRAEARRTQKAQAERSKTLGRRTNLIAADLRKIDLIGANLRGSCLIAADLRDVNLHGVDCIGADFRDTDLRGANLSRCIFLTQAQINVSKGDNKTKLPSSLTRPAHWE